MPLSPLPRAYALHLDYMAKNPATGPSGLCAKEGRYSRAISTSCTIGKWFERGLATRDAELIAIQRQSGWDPSDSPFVTLPPPAADADAGGVADTDTAVVTPVLTGTSWHWGRGRCPAACTANGGVCLPALGRCDCPRHRVGRTCETLVEPAVSRTHLHHGWCVYNDSSPYFCDKPLCVDRPRERFGREACVGDPVRGCPSRCNGKGTCRGGRCHCIPGYTGAACERSTVAWQCVSDCLGRGECDYGFCRCRAPYYGVDCSLEPPPPPRPSAPPPPPLPVGHLGVATTRLPPTDRRRAPRERCLRPCVYVYELPARMTVLALKAEPQWPFYDHGPADYRAYKAIHISLLRSAHRTTDPARADFFYVPTWDLHGSWGNPEVYWRAQRYIAAVWPFWNRTGGRDHIWTNTRDAGGCSNPWGSIWDQVANATLLTNWGGVTGLGGVPTERCFDATRDLVVPGVLRASKVAKSPFLPHHKRFPDNLEAAAASAADDAGMWARRTTLLFFHGSICWQTYDKVRSMKAMARKCKVKHGFLDHYSFGVRWQVYEAFKDEPGFELRATDMLPPPRHVSLDERMLHSTFCLCPSGTGWGMRVFHSAALGCVPVVIQRDAASAYPPVLQAFEGLVLDWDEVTVRVEPADVPRLPAILRALAANQTRLREKRLALARAWTRLLWREALPRDIARTLHKAPDAFDSLMQSLWLRLNFGLRGNLPTSARGRPRPRAARGQAGY